MSYDDKLLQHLQESWKNMSHYKENNEEDEEEFATCLKYIPKNNQFTHNISERIVDRLDDPPANLIEITFDTFLSITNPSCFKKLIQHHTDIQEAIAWQQLQLLQKEDINNIVIKELQVTPPDDIQIQSIQVIPMNEIKVTWIFSYEQKIRSRS